MNVGTDEWVLMSPALAKWRDNMVNDAIFYGQTWFSSHLFKVVSYKYSSLKYMHYSFSLFKNAHNWIHTQNSLNWHISNRSARWSTCTVVSSSCWNNKSWWLWNVRVGHITLRKSNVFFNEKGNLHVHILLPFATKFANSTLSIVRSMMGRCVHIIWKLTATAGMGSIKTTYTL